MSKFVSGRRRPARVTTTTPQLATISRRTQTLLTQLIKGRGAAVRHTKGDIRDTTTIKLCTMFPSR
jgi:hypothetical protein